MTDDRRALLEQAREWHRLSPNTPGMRVCHFCFADYPCLTARLAEALEGAINKLGAAALEAEQARS